MTVETSLSPALAHDVRFAPETRVWIYPCSRKLTDAEAEIAENQLLAFCKTWTAHNQALRAAAEIFENRLVILAVDESQAGASGCSIDKSVHFLEQLGQRLGVDFFDRMTFGWVSGDAVIFGNQTALAEAVRTGKISSETLMLNTLAKNRRELAEQWLVPFAQSWHRRLA